MYMEGFVFSQLARFCLFVGYTCSKAVNRARAHLLLEKYRNLRKPNFGVPSYAFMIAKVKPHHFELMMCIMK